MTKRLMLSDILAYADEGTLRDIAVHLLEAGHGEDEVIKDIARALDAMVAFDRFVPNPVVGAALEAADGPLFLLVARLIVRAAKRAIARRHNSVERG